MKLHFKNPIFELLYFSSSFFLLLIVIFQWTRQPIDNYINLEDTIKSLTHLIVI
jgi:hypothetical protein